MRRHGSSLCALPLARPRFGWRPRGSARGRSPTLSTSAGGFLPPSRFTPGFGPIALAWGWCLVGLLCGLLCGLLVGLYFEQLSRRAAGMAHVLGRMAFSAPPGLSAMPPWHQAVVAELARAGQGPRRVLLQRLCDDGDAALDLLAAAGGVTRLEALARILGDAAVRDRKVQELRSFRGVGAIWLEPCRLRRDGVA